MNVCYLVDQGLLGTAAKQVWSNYTRLFQMPKCWPHRTYTHARTGTRIYIYIYIYIYRLLVTRLMAFICDEIITCRRVYIYWKIVIQIWLTLSAHHRQYSIIGWWLWILDKSFNVCKDKVRLYIHLLIVVLVVSLMVEGARSFSSSRMLSEPSTWRIMAPPRYWSLISFLGQEAWFVDCGLDIRR